MKKNTVTVCVCVCVCVHEHEWQIVTTKTLLSVVVSAGTYACLPVVSHM